MKKLFLLSVAATLISSIVFAGVRRIGYWGTPVAGLDYATPALAVSASAIGDTIYVYGSNAGSAWTIDVTKRLVVVGSGYFYAPNTPGNANSNANLQNYNAYSSAAVQLFDGASGSIIIGVTGYVYCNTSHVSPINNIRISNCYWNASPTMLKGGITYDGWEISKCYIGYQVNYNPTTSRLTNFKILNNIFQSGSFGLSAVAGQTGIIENCTFYGYYYGNSFSGTNLLIQNCIFIGANVTSYNNCVFNNCVFDNAPNPGVVGANNILNVPANNLFIGLPTQGATTDDGRWALKAGSPAIAAGISGVDCGAFGGVNPYKLSGIPAVPAFYKLTAPSNAANSNPYTLTFSVRANN
ncbi:MAG: hypothetical protein ABIX01_02380 [Chitinophagaceae bacterium]